jgi:lipopolysaccharide biosynthesis glycosyltransferase
MLVRYSLPFMSNICFTTTLDDKYVQGFLITFNSMLRCSKNFNYDVVIFEWGSLSEENKNTIRTLYPNTKFKMIEVELYQQHKFDDTFRQWTYNCNYRFDVFALEEYDRVVFFDADMIFQIDVDELLSYEVDFGSSPIEAGRIPQINERMGFDAGLMSIGKKYLNKRVRQDLIDIANSPPPPETYFNTNNWFGNEPILNTYFLDKITWLPVNFNLVVSEVLLPQLNVKNNYQFTGHNKPWYGDTYETQFSAFALQNITNNNTKILSTIILKKLINVYKDEVAALKEKNIDIKDFASIIQPINEII